jgi:hypothetical protein
MADLLAPAARAARDGVTVNPFQAYLLSIAAPIYTHRAESAAIFAPAGMPLRPGDTLRNSALADTFDLLARQGEALFLDGEIGREIIRQSRALGGHLDAEEIGFGGGSLCPWCIDEKIIKPAAAFGRIVGHQKAAAAWRGQHRLCDTSGKQPGDRRVKSVAAGAKNLGCCIGGGLVTGGHNPFRHVLRSPSRLPAHDSSARVNARAA